MSKLSCGIVGLPNVGKSTLFNALTKKGIASANYPFCTIEPNEGIVFLKDMRLDTLSKMSGSKNILYAPITFVDIAGLVAGASKGEGLGNKFLTNIRETDVIVHVVRCFEDPDILHVTGKVSPIADIEVINTELILADLSMAETIKTNIGKKARTDSSVKPKLAAIEKVYNHLDTNTAPLRTLALTADEKAELAEYNFLTSKPVLYLTNIAESDLKTMTNPFVEQVRAFAAKEGNQILPICAKLEEDLSTLDDADSLELLKEYGQTESGLDRLGKVAFDLLGLITFITTGEIETRAWTIKRGSTAPVAAGAIHTDFEKKFIRAEVVKYEDFVALGSRAKARDVGKARDEGKDYIVQDGDIIIFKHGA